MPPKQQRNVHHLRLQNRAVVKKMVLLLTLYHKRQVPPTLKIQMRDTSQLPDTKSLKPTMHFPQLALIFRGNPFDLRRVLKPLPLHLRKDRPLYRLVEALQPQLLRAAQSNYHAAALKILVTGHIVRPMPP